MADLWASAPLLLGKTLQTATGRQFDVVTVGEAHLVVRIASTGNDRRIYRREIEATEALWQETGTAPTPGAIRDAQASEANPAYMVPIIQELRGLRQKA